jgi:hypothetical protein
VAGGKLFHHAQHLQYANAFGQAGFVPVDARTGQAASSTSGRESPKPGSSALRIVLSAAGAFRDAEGNLFEVKARPGTAPADASLGTRPP